MSKSQNFVMAEAAEQSIRGLIKAFGPKVFVTGLNNACVHGEIFEEMDLEVSDAALVTWYEGIEKLSTAAKEIIA
jgi:hypothetical protein